MRRTHFWPFSRDVAVSALALRVTLQVALYAIAAAAFPATAADYPTRQVRVVVPFPPGGVADNVGRPVAEAMSRHLKQSIVVENKGGAGSALGAEIVAKAIPDGHTIMLTSVSFAINAGMRKQLPFDPVRDLAPVMQVSGSPGVLVVHPSVPVKSVKDLIALAKKAPGQISFSHTGVGSATHLAGALLEGDAGVGDRLLVGLERQLFGAAVPALAELGAAHSQNCDLVLDTPCHAGLLG